MTLRNCLENLSFSLNRCSLFSLLLNKSIYRQKSDSFTEAPVTLLKIWQHSSILEKKNGNHMATIWRPTGIRQFLDVAAVPSAPEILEVPLS